MTSIVYMPEGHDLKSFLCSLAVAEVCSAQSSWGGTPSDMLSSTSIASKLSKPESEMASLTMHPSLETSETLSRRDMRKPTPVTLTLSAAASLDPASPLALPESKQAPTTSATCGPQHLTPYAQLDPGTASLKTFQASLLVDILNESYATLPKAGIACDGVVYRLPRWERLIGENDSGLSLPTPTAQNTKRESVRQPHWKMHSGMTLADYVTFYPTPRTRDWKGSGKDCLDTAVGGQLNPTWVEWLMGWPLGWTDLKPLAMDKYQSVRQSHFSYWLEANLNAIEAWKAHLGII